MGISWQPAGQAAVASYELWRGDALVARVAEPQAVDPGLKPWTRYCYTVRALGPAGAASPPSAEACARTLDDQAPTAPGRVTAVPLPGNGAQVSWEASTDDAGVAGYDVLRGSDRIQVPRATTLTDTGLSPTKEYCYTVRAFDPAGNRSEPSSAACVLVPDTTPPSVPDRLVARAPAETEVRLTWDPSVDDVGVARYEVARSGAARPPLSVGESAAADLGLVANTTYCYRVRACDAAGNCSALSREACATTPDLTPPSTPEGLSTSAASDREIEVRWAAATDNVGVAGYELRRDGKALARLGAETGFRDASLKPGIEYCYAVRALDAAGNRSPASTPVCATTPDLTQPTTPGNPAALAVSSSQVFVAWDPSTDDVGVAGYEVLRGAIVVATVKATRARELKLESRKEYCYRIRAFDAAGNRSEPTGSVCATTTSPTELAAPSDLRVRRLSATSVFLQWEPSESQGVVYRVYAQGKPIGTTGASTYTPSGKLGAESNCYRVSAVDLQGRESQKSNEICAQPAGQASTL